MVSKFTFALFLGATILVIVSGAPRAINNEVDLKKSVVEFLSQDKQFLAALEHSGLVESGPESLFRQKRESEYSDIDQSVETGEEAPKDGFFDRAAKFVVDLLQRFLKWINSSDN